GVGVAVAAGGPGRGREDLAAVPVRRQAFGRLGVARRGNRGDDDLGARERLAEIGRRSREPRRPRSPVGGERDRRIAGERSQGLGRSCPQADRVARERQGGCHRESAVARAGGGDGPATAPGGWSSAIFTFEYLSTRARISLVCSPRRGGGATGRPIAPSILTGVPRVCVLPWRGWFISTTIPRCKT